MQTATRFALAALAFVLWAAPAAAQNDVTFQVDLNPYITTCQFNRQTNSVFIAGELNDWSNSATALADADENGIYTTTVSLPEGAVLYKFYVSGSSVLDWEADPNRSYTVVAGAQTVPVVAFRGPTPADACSAVPRNYEIVFEVDMNAQIARGVFNPQTQEVRVAGNFTDWGTGAVTLAPTLEDGKYSALVNVDNVLVPGALQYKYIMRDPALPQETRDRYEGGPNYTLNLTGNEPDADGDGRREAFAAPRFFSGVSFDQILEADATVTFSVDLRPAYYYRADVGPLPGAGGPISDITGLFINGPAMWESNAGGGPAGGILDWQAWGPQGLGADARFAFVNTSTADSTWSLTLTYPRGALKRLIGKLGVNGADNEAASENDHFFRIQEGNQTINLVFGAVLRENGTYDASRGPGGQPLYAPYLNINNTTTPPIVSSTRRSGQAVSVEGGEIARGLSLSAPYPNPVAGRARFDLTLDRASDVRVTLVDLMGRTVATLVEGAFAAGTTPVEMAADSLAAGIYVLRVEAAGTSASRRLTVVR